MSEPDAASVGEAAHSIRQRISAAGADPAEVTILAVTKTFSASTARAAVEAGLHGLGENYASELLDKAEALTGVDVAWHYLGAIQTNKVAKLAPVVDCFQGVARLKEGVAIARHRPDAAVMVQVDFTGRPDRGGVATSDVGGLVDGLRGLGLEVRGLMTVAPEDPDEARKAFRAVRMIADDFGLKERSMGMTGDLEIAVEEGSTMVRIGRALFGARG